MWLNHSMWPYHLCLQSHQQSYPIFYYYIWHFPTKDAWWLNCHAEYILANLPGLCVTAPYFSPLSHILHCHLNVLHFLFFELSYFLITVSFKSEKGKRQRRHDDDERKLTWMCLIQTWFRHMRMRKMAFLRASLEFQKFPGDQVSGMSSISCPALKLWNVGKYVNDGRVKVICLQIIKRKSHVLFVCLFLGGSIWDL